LQAFQLTDIIINKPIITWLRTHSQALTTLLEEKIMKPVKNFVFAALLVLSIALHTVAGDIDHPGIAAPPPPRQMTTIYDGTTSGSNTEQPDSITVETADYLFLEALAALLSVY
jgi:hypothetical protein